MTCQTDEKPLRDQLRDKKQHELWAELEVSLAIASLKRALEMRRRIREEKAEIETKIAEKKKK